MKNTLIFLGLLLFFFSCTPDKETPKTGNSVDYFLKEGTKISLTIQPLINSTPLQLGKYYHLKDGDSILVEELSFYLANPKLTHPTGADSSNNVYLFRSGNYTQDIYVKLTNANAQKLILTQGLNDAQNGSNPTSFVSSHPMSTYTNMYWDGWTKYRYLVFEGKIKIANETRQNSFVYHTGLVYSRYIELALNQSLNITGENTLNANLHIDKIFYPNAGNTINYRAGEWVTHSQPNQDAITQKVSTNFSAAFQLD